MEVLQGVYKDVSSKAHKVAVNAVCFNCGSGIHEEVQVNRYQDLVCPACKTENTVLVSSAGFMQQSAKSQVAAVICAAPDGK